jgi:GDP-L-fucose synthase
LNKDQDKIFIAGHGGLIGSAILKKLKENGFKHLIYLPRDDLDLEDKSSVVKFFLEQKPDYVFLAAGKVAGIVENKTFPAEFIQKNLAIQNNVFMAAQLTTVKKLIFFASSCMYPRACPQPMSEDMLLSGKLEPTSIAYAISKLAGLYSCLAYNQQYKNNEFIPLIPNSVFGPHDNFNPDSGHVLSALISRFHDAIMYNYPSVTLWGSGNARREFIYSEDVADAAIFMMSQSTSKIEMPINIGVGSDISIKELAFMLKNLTGFKGEILWDTSKPEGAPQKLLDSSRINQIGWKSQHSLEESILKTYSWFKENVA